MMKFCCALLCLSVLAIAFADPYVRFVNQIEGRNLTVYSDALPVMQLPFMNSTAYVSVPSGSLSITNVVDQNGTSLTNGVSLLLTFDTYATAALVWTQGQFTLVRLLENTSAPVMTDATKAYVRVINLGEGVQYISVATVAGTISSYQGFLVATNYQQVDPSITSEFRIFNSVSGTYNTPIITIPATLTAGKAYTVFFFTPSNGIDSAYYVYDHDAIISSGSPMTTGSVAQMTTGVAAPQMTTGNTPSPITSGQAQNTPMTTGQVVGSNNNQTPNSSASQLCSLGMLVTMIAVLLI